MKTIFKYPLLIVDEQSIPMPGGGLRALHAGLDCDGYPCVWFVVDLDLSIESRRIYIVGTGHELPYSANTHIGTFAKDPCVWHVFTT